MTDEKIFVEVMAVIFMALGQAAGPRMLVNASVILAQIAHSKALDPKAREIVQQILVAADGIATA
jgi:hypothetical protein